MEYLTAIIECSGDEEEAAMWLRVKDLASAPSLLTSGAAIAPAATENLTVWCGNDGQEQDLLGERALPVIVPESFTRAPPEEQEQWTFDWGLSTRIYSRTGSDPTRVTGARIARPAPPGPNVATGARATLPAAGGPAPALRALPRPARAPTRRGALAMSLDTLFHAAERGDVDDVERFIAAGADLNQPNWANGGFTPLHMAGGTLRTPHSTDVESINGIIYRFDIVILDIGMGYGLMMWEMTVLVWSSPMSIWDILSLCDESSPPPQLVSMSVRPEGGSRSTSVRVGLFAMILLRGSRGWGPGCGGSAGGCRSGRQRGSHSQPRRAAARGRAVHVTLSNPRKQRLQPSA